ncbi:hypothetical protein SAMN05720766_1326 [Fibrobacter sp. UWH9]|uniref:hypothetical protein n=1 Tax=Fibrobacter sp. UWH9 TaxID=1896213 RepID=UPI00091F9983|nr:hypothetical protein [Fibrobacter sp. UWH9]SHH87649.1 hypothetical protein SAMN05720766_1326 [Fibrobacter sp. UWH9]
MNKFLVLLVTTTVLVWGVFLFKMSDKVDSQKSSEMSMWEELSGKSAQDIETRLDFKSLLSRLIPQDMPADSLRDPFKQPVSILPPPPKPRVVKVAEPVAAPVTVAAPPPPKPPSITLDAILPGDNPVAIIKFRGESAVVSVGQEIWNVVVQSIESNRVVLQYAGGTFEIR